MLSRNDWFFQFDVGWFLERASSVTATITPLLPAGNDREILVKVSLPGYKILQPIDFKP
jgi:hypothetical protein